MVVAGKGLRILRLGNSLPKDSQVGGVPAWHTTTMAGVGQGKREKKVRAVAGGQTVYGL